MTYRYVCNYIMWINKKRENKINLSPFKIFFLKCVRFLQIFG